MFELAADGVRCELRIPIGNGQGEPADGDGERNGT
jgi:hypothetical protein